MDQGAWRATVHSVAKSQAGLGNPTTTATKICAGLYYRALSDSQLDFSKVSR